MFDFLLNKFLKLKLNKNNELVGRIYNLENKLNGKLPVNKLELIKLINSWGRNNSGSIPIKDNENNEVNFSISEPKECYDLSRFQTVFVKTNTCSRAMLTN